MRKIFLFILLLIGFFSEAQVLQVDNTYGREQKRLLVNTSIGFPRDTFPVPVNYQNDSWWATKGGSLYRWDTTAYIWRLFGNPTTPDCDADGVAGGTGSVTWQGTGFNFSVAPAIYTIDCTPYASDSGSVTLSAADPDFDRFDVIYLGTDNAFHILEGEPSASAAIPQVQGDEIALTAILVPAGSTAFEPDEQIVYDENTESTVSNTGTTTNGANATNIFRGTLSTNVTNINNGDIIYFTKNPVPSTWDITGIDILQLHIKLKAVMPTLANLRVQFYNGTTSAVSAEVAIPLDRSNTTTYQAISIPLSAFGNITTNQFTRVRFRYTSNNATNYSGFYLDYISFIDNLPTLPPTGAQVSLTLNSNGNAIVINPSNQIQNGGTWTLLGGGTSGQYVDGTLTVRAFPTLLSQMGAVDGRSKTSEGGTIDGTTFYQQLANDDYPGLLSPTLYTKLNRNDSIQNLGTGDTLLVFVNDSLMGVKSIVFGDEWGVNANEILIDTTGGGVGGGARFGLSGEDDEAAEDRSFNLNDQNFSISRTDGSTTTTFSFASAADVGFHSSGLAGTYDFTVTQLGYLFTNLEATTATTIKMVIWDSATNQLRSAAIPTGSGGDNIYNTDGTLTDSRNVDLDGNSLNFLNGATNLLSIDPNANTVTIKDPLKLLGSTSGSVDIFSDALSNALNGTTLSGTGFIPVTMMAFQKANNSLSDVNTAQDVFASDRNTVTLRASTTYRVEGIYSFTHGATSHSVGMSFAASGAGSISAIYYWVIGSITAVNTTTATQTMTFVNQASNTAVNQAGANGAEQFRFYGYITTGSGGTVAVTPQITFSAAPGGSPATVAGSHITFTPVGTDAMTIIGNFN